MLKAIINKVPIRTRTANIFHFWVKTIKKVAGGRGGGAGGPFHQVIFVCDDGLGQTETILIMFSLGMQIEGWEQRAGVDIGGKGEGELGGGRGEGELGEGGKGELGGGEVACKVSS
jgi:hypothetical protein